MAITQKELEISNISYTNKDFESIYNELLDYAEKLSTRFSPASANESDPFVILLKLVAFVSDKINYNVDKNILEQFMLSCTQETSMSDLANMLGYNMRYYRSATTDIVFKYNFSNSTESEESFISIPAYSIVSNGSDIQYLTLTNATVSSKTGLSETVPVMQGIIKTLSVLESDLIQLENLNSNNTIYLPERMVAENGIFISNSKSASWESVDNLNTTTYGSYVYKFGYDSKEMLPFIEFPSWISDIIQEGLSIKYVITDGESGNISANTLTSVSRVNVSDDINDDDIEVVNSYAASNGMDPETIDETYAGFKKTIGTFDTLVTCRDYANAIYNLVNSSESNIVSNIIVSDRRDDINYSCNVITLDRSDIQPRTIISSNYSISGRLINLGDSELPEANSDTFALHKDDIFYKDSSYYRITKSEEIYSFNPITLEAIPLGSIYYNTNLATYYKLVNSAFPDSNNFIWEKMSDSEKVIDANDLCVYPMRPISNTSYIAYNDSNGYNQSFEKLDDLSTQDFIYENYEIDNLKTISHNFKKLKDSDIFTVRNYYQLDCVINTNYKVNILEEQEIISNINNALIEAFNPRKLNLGYEIVFDELLDVISKSDSRIKTVSLQEPIQTPVIVTVDGKEHNLITDNIVSDHFKLILAKNILSGRISVFDYDNRFDYSYSYKKTSLDTDIISFTSECNLSDITEASNSYKLKSNEVIQFIAPKFITKQIYPYGIEYYLTLNGSNSIPKNAIYKLNVGDILILKYTNSNDEEIKVEYDSNSDIYINPNIELFDTNYRKNDLNETPTSTEGIEGSSKYYYTLSANDEIVVKSLNSDSLNTYKKCYWLTNSENNKINWIKYDEAEDDGPGYYILEDNEYFFYTDIALSSLFAYGPGTKLSIDKCPSDTSTLWSHNSYISADSITKDGLTAVQDNFITIDFSNNTLQLIQNDLLTLISGDEIKVSFDADVSDKKLTIPNNIFNSFDSGINIQYKLSSDSNFKDLQLRPIQYNWQVRSILDLNAGPNTSQNLVGNQKFEFIKGTYSEDLKKYIPTDTTVILSASSDFSSFKLSLDVKVNGGKNISLQYLDIDLKYKCPSLFAFSVDPEVDNYVENINSDFNSIKGFTSELNTKVLYVSPNLSTLQIAAQDLSLNTNSRFIMINNTELDSLGFVGEISSYKQDSDDLISAMKLINYINNSENYVSTIILKNGLNVIEIKDSQEGICEKLKIKITPKEGNLNPDYASAYLYISKLKVVTGINKNLGIPSDTDIIDFMLKSYPEQMKQFAICSSLESIRTIDVSDDYPMTSAHAFYDSNNVINKWVVPKIDLSISNIRISKNSKKNLI